jgi:hypothetical protein
MTTSTEQWRGRFDEEQPDDLPIDESVPRRREARALLGSLLRPYRWTVAVLALVVVVENVARLSVPILVQRGIDHGIPPIIDGGSAHTLLMIVATLCAVVVVQAVSRVFFLRRSGRIAHSTRATPRAGWSAGRRTTSRPSRTCSRPDSTV